MDDDCDEDEPQEQVDKNPIHTGLGFDHPENIIEAGLKSDQTGDAIKLGYVVLKKLYGL